MGPKQQLLNPYSVKIETPTGKSTTLPVTLLTPKQAEEVQAEFKKLAQDAGVNGKRDGILAPAVEDARHLAGPPQPPRRARTRGIAGLHRERCSLGGRHGQPMVAGRFSSGRRGGTLDLCRASSGCCS